MSNIYVRNIIEKKNWRSQDFDFLALKNVPPDQFWGVPTHEDIEF